MTYVEQKEPSHNQSDSDFPPEGYHSYQYDDFDRYHSSHFKNHSNSEDFYRTENRNSQIKNPKLIYSQQRKYKGHIVCNNNPLHIYSSSSSSYAFHKPKKKSKVTQFISNQSQSYGLYSTFLTFLVFFIALTTCYDLSIFNYSGSLIVAPKSLALDQVNNLSENSALNDKANAKLLSNRSLKSKPIDKNVVDSQENKDLSYIKLNAIQQNPSDLPEYREFKFLQHGVREDGFVYSMEMEGLKDSLSRFLSRLEGKKFFLSLKDADKDVGLSYMPEKNFRLHGILKLILGNIYARANSEFNLPLNRLIPYLASEKFSLEDPDYKLAEPSTEIEISDLISSMLSNEDNVAETALLEYLSANKIDPIKAIAEELYAKDLEKEIKVLEKNKDQRYSEEVSEFLPIYFKKLYSGHNPSLDDENFKIDINDLSDKIPCNSMQILGLLQKVYDNCFVNSDFAYTKIYDDMQNSTWHGHLDRDVSFDNFAHVHSNKSNANKDCGIITLSDKHYLIVAVCEDSNASSILGELGTILKHWILQSEGNLEDVLLEN